MGANKSGNQMTNNQDRSREWTSLLAISTSAFLAFETLSGLSVWLLPFNVPNQLLVFLHTLLGVVFLVPCTWYVVRHWLLYRPYLMTHIKLLGYVGMFVLAGANVSGAVLTVEALRGPKISYAWDTAHIVLTFALVAFVLPHIILVVVRDRRAKAMERLAGGPAEGTEAAAERLAAAAEHGRALGSAALASVAVVGLLWYAYPGMKILADFPGDYNYKYGKNRPFAPSLARTATGGAYASGSLAGSHSCGTSGCHEQIVEEWEASAHRYSAMDPGFQAIQLNMARQNGAESTRYCGGCHDPISLFSGAKNIYTEAAQLTGLDGYREGVSCLVCHAVREVDLKGNANYVLASPARYMFELEYDTHPTATLRVLRDFLIRAYPRPHLKALSKRLFKTPEYCAACHKQFVDQEINKIGWVQLQNQYDNWRKSRWNHPGQARRTIECRECHMPLTDSRDPAAGDTQDYNRSANDGKHRSHRFIAANQLVPPLLKLKGWEKQVELTNRWLRGAIEIPEIADKWSRGPAVSVQLFGPEQVRPREPVEIKVLVTSNKVGHDFPTGPLDIIQAWIELTVRDLSGRVVYTSGAVDAKGFIQPGSFIFKAEPVDQYGNLIDRHNLWEMVGVRHRRALFPGFSDTAEFRFLCPETAPRSAPVLPAEKSFRLPPPGAAGELEVTARLLYRKVDQYLLNFIFGADKGLTSPISEMAVARHRVTVLGRSLPRTHVAMAGRGPEPAPSAGVAAKGVCQPGCCRPPASARALVWPVLAAP